MPDYNIMSYIESKDTEPSSTVQAIASTSQYRDDFPDKSTGFDLPADYNVMSYLESKDRETS